MITYYQSKLSEAVQLLELLSEKVKTRKAKKILFIN